MTTGDRIKQRRKELGITADVLGAEVGVDRSTIYRYEKGDIEKVPSNILEPLATALATTSAYLMGWTDDPVDYDNGDLIASIPLSYIEHFNGDIKKAYNAWQGITTQDSYDRKPTRRKGVRIPVLGQVPAGIPIEAITDFDYDDPDDWEEISEEMAAAGTYFALRIKGDSMTPTICDGDIVIVRQQEDVNSGEIAIVMVNGDDATCKRVVKQTQGISLVANNPAYEPRFFTNREIVETPVRVIGKVVELRRSF